MRASRSGMTLIETVVWIAVLTSAIIALCSALLYFYKTNNFALQDENAVQSAQHAMDAAVRAIRTASYSDNGAYPVISIAPNQMIFYSGVNKGDPLTQEVRFFVSGTSFEEGITEPSGDPYVYSTSTEVITDLSDYAQNAVLATSTFSYYDQNGALISDYSKFSSARFVTINLIVDVSTSSLPTQLTLRSSAAMRNLITH